MRPPDFVAFARSFGADGAQVTGVAAMRPAIERAFASPVPYILDVRIGCKFPYPDYAAALAELDGTAPNSGCESQYLNLLRSVEEAQRGKVGDRERDSVLE